MESERLTEGEWCVREARRECARYGHDWQILQTIAQPVALKCCRPCGDPGYALVREVPPGAARADLTASEHVPRVPGPSSDGESRR